MPASPREVRLLPLLPGGVVAPQSSQLSLAAVMRFCRCFFFRLPNHHLFRLSVFERRLLSMRKLSFRSDIQIQV